MRAAIVALVCLTGLCAVGLSAPAPAKRSCAQRGSDVLRTIGSTVVYRSRPARVRRVRACRGTREMMLAANDYYEGFGGRRAVAARGLGVAWATVSRNDGLDGDVPVLNVVARDFGTDSHRVVAKANGTRYALNTSGFPVSARGVPSIVLTRDRGVAWIACDAGSSSDENLTFDRCGTGPRSVWLAPDGTGVTRRDSEPRELARGWSIEARSLRIDRSGRVLSWREAGRMVRIQLAA